MATVYRALDLEQQRDVALKVLSPEMAQQENFGARLRREATVLFQLRHPNIVPVENYGEEEGHAYLVMPYLQAGTLKDRMAQGPLDLREASRLVGQVCAALHFAHEKGVVHRDVKPANILLDGVGNALVTDFGLARLHDASLSLTGSALLGTPAFISPEQARGLKADHRSDQYALGVILFQLATGELPFDADTPMAILLKQLNEPLPLPRSINPRIPESVEQVILKATAKNPEHRFASMVELSAAFQAAVAHTLDPKKVPAPRISLPKAEPDGAQAPRRAPLPSAWSYTLLRLGLTAGTVVLFLLACPLAANSALTLLQRASSPAEGSSMVLATPRRDQAAAIAATLGAIPTVTPSSPVMPANDKGGASVTMIRTGEVSCARTQLTEAAVSGKNVRWLVINVGATPLSVEALRLRWPGTNGPLGRLYFAQEVIWEGSLSSPIALSLLDTPADRRMIPPGQGAILTLTFAAAAESSGYEIAVVMPGACVASRLN
jgi:hypothetical protein